MASPNWFYLYHFAFLIMFLSGIVLAYAGPHPEPRYLKSFVNTTDCTSRDYYDPIIVEGGTAGCPLAATLSFRFKVLVLEQGGVFYGDRNLMTTEGFWDTIMDVSCFDSPTQVRIRILQDSSAMNDGFYSRGDQYMCTKTNEIWDLRMLNESYEWVERETVLKPELRTWKLAVRHRLFEAGVDTYNGLRFYHVESHSAADVKPLNSQAVMVANSEITFFASSDTVTFAVSRQSAVGVILHDGFPRFHHVVLPEHGEVVLSGATIGSPMLGLGLFAGATLLLLMVLRFGRVPDGDDERDLNWQPEENEDEQNHPPRIRLPRQAKIRANRRIRVVIEELNQPPAQEQQGQQQQVGHGLEQQLALANPVAHQPPVGD